MKLSQARLKELLYWDAEVGEFYWKLPSDYAYSVAGTKNKKSNVKFIILKDYGSFTTARLVWLWYKGTLPALVVGHKDGNPLNNNIENLYLKQGVYWYKQTKKWRAAFKVNGERIHVGFFEDYEAALNSVRAARVKAKLQSY